LTLHLPPGVSALERRPGSSQTAENNSRNTQIKGRPRAELSCEMLARAAVLALLAVPLAYAFTPSLTNLPALHHSSATSIGRGGNGLMHVPATRMARVAAMGLRMAEKGPLHDAIDKVARSSNPCASYAIVLCPAWRRRCRPRCFRPETRPADVLSPAMRFVA
jgi:hypothetical protein